MSTRKLSPGLKGQTQRERASHGLVSTIMVTSLGTHITAEDALPSIISSFRKSEQGQCAINTQKVNLGHRIESKKGLFTFFVNTPEASNIMKAKIQGADINIILVDKKINNEICDLISQTKQDNLIFLSCLRDVPSEIKKDVKKTFGKAKIYGLNEISRVLENKTVLNRKRYTRPHFFPDTIEHQEERLFKITGSVDKGFVSPQLLINGFMSGRIRQVSAHGKVLDISGLAMLTKEDLYQKKKDDEEEMTDLLTTLRIKDSQINDQPEYSDDSIGCINVEETQEEDDEEEEDSEDDSENYADLEGMAGDEDLCDVDSDDLMGYTTLEKENIKKDLVNKYKGFKGLRSINMGLHKKENCKENETLKVFRTQNLPEYYKNLSFIGSERVRRRILSKKSPIPVQTPLEIIIEISEEHMQSFESAIMSGFLSIHGLFDYEGALTVCALSFQTKETISIHDNNLVFDFGFTCTAPSSCVMGNGVEVVKCKTEGTSGTVCFVGPLILTSDKIAIYKGDRCVGSALHATRKDPILIRTVVFKGIPAKILRRSCIVSKMFHSREEVKYFKGIKLYSSMKKEGHIKRPLGESGLMKCYFFPPVKHGEKIYMELARRVFISPEN
ncbi:pre-rRNA-processing protein TSR1 [Nematocida ausubeli]|uniref:Ribosome biogenesis protein BMS1/TSR1 C-terminal domain-containing protein n=1 Tax=Nematocida ausubeli (strain ATCC PRA-371 / ERTm2) TaxID=1913371 RepID=A0A086J1H9_NEMA1|nr:uncharacterized protein NESG_01109 [Nematocida ausubeli]KAI5132522.1 pre-rRNA-processing protein TSR1 [Nematocida ausubeli]KAI5135103.1 pre-rRNA-processing protein TSR1 [Nematocida ausubeli]KAI5147061.1 pre-rRNA-processing protein TSR1 [Nematocida ausubeli]KAI5161340.1 pre-rRNA-processing protein TSR1 [Nematocida ausubeli]KFG25997.1 hypothetical protein NESG_01109 [Nematocida ausubeli]